ncbi:MAG TPA: type II toxin-antitoxin system VapC family toxin [Nitrospiria bacterium]|nr:type II toxin-antitoxin system VapC family toxin [Nitrospiria bacterium]
MSMRIFIDTSAFYALEDADDQHHEKAQSIKRRFQEERPMLFTTHHILAESVTLIGSRLLPHRAITFARHLLLSRIIRIVRTDEEIEQAALNVYERFDDPRLSFTDCLSFTVMRALGITTAFGFDRHFERAGFLLLYEERG